ncbi:patatin-like phospholipase family protein [Kineosporia sp. A_224]|uniref:patatin-like phospholipase family protein n=1 Tax=Kineosporia sp. A_224 TaxID=1962180 RepID=UPI000B4A68A4|nr:patatin-like phospholipase family protein [Kineosporia sp. A_224]
MTRWGLVLGGGGVLGGAWMVGALTALEQVHSVDARDAEVIIGTSAGSVMAAMLGAGVSVEELRAHQLGEAVTSGPLAESDWNYDTSTGGPLPPFPRLTPGSTGLFTHNMGRLRRLPPTAVLSAFLPEGRGRLDAVGRLIGALVPSGWAAHPGVRTVAMDYESGRRTAFGAPGAPPADLAEAVMASCAIPGWYTPVTIGGRRYVDGGACSATNVDLAAGLGLDEVFVLAPMVSFAFDSPTHWRAMAERRWRGRVTRRCLREVAKVHAGGTDVTVIGPGPEDLEAIGANLMAVERRRTVLETSLLTSTRALGDPEPLQHLPAPVREQEQDVDPTGPDPDHDGGSARAHLEEAG